MRRFHWFGVAMLGLLVAAAGTVKGQAVSIESGQGSVDKADKETLTVQTRTAAGQFGKKLVLKLTGTSKLTAVALEKRGGKLVPVQREVEAVDLEAGQPIVFIHSGGPDPILLAAVVQRGGAKK